MSGLRKVSSVIFVPPNAQKIERLFEKDSIEEDLMTIEEKVERDPFSRETILFRASLSSGVPVETHRNTRTEKTGSVKITDPKSKVYSGKKEFLKNTTESTILMQLNRKIELDQKGRPMPGFEPFLLKRYLHKSKMTKEDLESYELQTLIDAGKIEEITRQQYQEELAQIPEEKSEIEERKPNPKKIGAAGGGSGSSVFMGSSTSSGNVSDDNGPTISFDAKSVEDGDSVDMNVLIQRALNNQESGTP